MATYTVKSAVSTPRPDKGNGPMQSIAMVVQEYGQAETTAAEYYAKATTPVPVEGSTIEGEITPGQYGPKFKRAQQGGGGGGGWKAKPPEERRSIAMQHAQKCAVTLLELAAQHGDYKPPNAGDAVEQVKAVAWILFRQVQAAETTDREQS